MLIPLDQLEPHPANANVMPERLLAKLHEHIRVTGQYPPLIVRAIEPCETNESRETTSTNGRSPTDTGARPRYQILDGHHRAIVLRRLGRSHAQCDVWTGIDDRQASVLLLTLNRLHGEDDPQRRGMLLRDLASEHDLPADALARLLPDDLERITKLIDLAGEAASDAVIAAPDEVDAGELPQAITFFVTAAQRASVIERLKSFDRDRGVALVKALGLASDN